MKELKDIVAKERKATAHEIVEEFFKPGMYITMY